MKIFEVIVSPLRFRSPSSIKKSVTWMVAALSLQLFAGANAIAEGSDDGHAAENGHSGVSHHHNVGIFLGKTRDAKHHTDNTFGLEYEYRFTNMFGAGAIYEKSPDAHKDDGVTVTLLSGFFHFADHWRVTAAFGKEKVGNHHGDENVKRLGITYEFHMPKFFIAPTLNVDYIKSEKLWVGGVVIGKSF